MTPQRLFNLAAEFAQATGNAERFHTLAATTTDDNDRAAHAAKATTWEAVAASRREELRAALRDTLRDTVRAVPDDERLSIGLRPATHCVAASRLGVTPDPAMPHPAPATGTGTGEAASAPGTSGEQARGRS